MTKKEVRVLPIKEGTVIDHITAGQALRVLRILGITETSHKVVSVAMNVPSRAMGKKDIVKVENRELVPREVHKIALITPQASINIIRNYKVIEKYLVSLPSEVVGVLRCANPNCISNTSEPATPKFIVKESGLRCYYCERTAAEDIMNYLL
jgi:aspartate carbamoyltransferase regulatory subunit